MSQRLTELTLDIPAHDRFLKGYNHNGKKNLLRTHPFIEGDRRAEIANQFIRRCLREIVIVNNLDSRPLNHVKNGKIVVNPSELDAINYVYDDVECILEGPKNLAMYPNGNGSRESGEFIEGIRRLKLIYAGKTVHGFEYSNRIWATRGATLEWEIIDFAQLYNQIGTGLNAIFMGDNEKNTDERIVKGKMWTRHVVRLRNIFEKWKSHSQLEREHESIFDRGYLRVLIPDNLEDIAEETAREPYLRNSMQSTDSLTYNHWREILSFRYGRAHLLFP